MQNPESVRSELFRGSSTALHPPADVLAASKKVRLAQTLSSERRRREDKREQSPQEEGKVITSHPPHSFGGGPNTRHRLEHRAPPPRAARWLPPQGAWWGLWMGNLAGNGALGALGARQRSPSQTLLPVTAQPAHQAPAAPPSRAQAPSWSSQPEGAVGRSRRPETEKNYKIFPETTQPRVLKKTFLIKNNYP